MTGIVRVFRISRICQASRMRLWLGLLILGVLRWTVWAQAASGPVFNHRELKTNDLVAFVGGADVAAAQFHGHLEALLAAAHPTVRFRDFGWEGDTVFEQPREVGFPPLAGHLRKAGATVIFLQFGRTESWGGELDLAAFTAALQALVRELAQITPRLVLVTPPPFENPGGLLPDLSQRNPDLERYVAAIEELARSEALPMVNLFAALRGRPERVTDDGLQLSPFGHALVGQVFAERIGLLPLSAAAGSPQPSGEWKAPLFEQLRQRVISKNRFWFDYWRPQNWAFLGGDRTSQPSSRDHRDPKIRWFPVEIEKFQGLIAQQEKEIARLAAELGKRE